MGDWIATHSAVSGVLGGMIVTALSLWPQRSRADCNGWRMITPGTMHWVGLVLAGAFASLLTFIAQAHPPDPTECACQDQNDVYAFWGLLVFAWGATGLFVHLIRRIRASRVEWFGGQIAFNEPGGHTRFCLMTHVEQIAPSATGYVCVTFFDGTVLKLDQYARGVSDLCQAIIDINDDPGMPDGWAERPRPGRRSIGEGIAH